MKPEKSNPPQVALVLGSGAARGLTHIGVLKVLEENKIPVHLVTGTSMGAMIGGAFASGLNPAQLEEIACETNWLRVAQILFPKKLQSSALLDGGRVEDFLLALVGERKIEQLLTPFACIAADIWSGEEIVLESGSLIKAIRASISFPFLFTPLEINGRLLADGGIVNPLPVNTAREMGADIVIAVGATPSVSRHIRHVDTGKTLTRKKMAAASDSSSFIKRFLKTLDENGALKRVLTRPKAKLKKPGLRRQMIQIGNAMENQILTLRLKESPPDVLIIPQVDDFQFFDFARTNEIIAAGESAARRVLPELFRLLAG